MDQYIGLLPHHYRPLKPYNLTTCKQTTYTLESTEESERQRYIDREGERENERERQRERVRDRDR